MVISMVGKWVIDYNTVNLLNHPNFRKEFDTEEEAIEWGKELNRQHEFEFNGQLYPLNYMHLVYEPEFIEDDAPAQEGE